MVQPLPLEEEPIGLIKGQMPDSKEEYWVAQALYKYDVDFEFQWEIGGGTSRRGGLTVDSVVWNPMINPLLVYGEYWRRGEAQGGDVTRMIAIDDYFKVAIENILVLWGEDAQTQEDVEQWVRENVAN